MSKHKSQLQKDIEHTVIHPLAEKVGAVLLVGVSLLVSAEAIIENHPKFGHHADHDQTTAAHQVFARGEAKGETARLPEEFDIGLQTPRVSGL